MSDMYIYGIIKSQATNSLPLEGLPDDIRIISEDKVAAIVGNASHDGMKNLQRDEAMRILLYHQRVVEKVLATTTILPVKFGTILPDETFVQRMLQLGQQKFLTSLEEFSNYLQMDLAVEWVLNDVFTEISSKPDIVQYRAEVQAHNSTAAKVQLGIAVEKALQQRRTLLADQMHQKLQTVARDIVTNAVMNDAIVVNMALLMEQSNLGALDTALEELDVATEGKLKFRCIGPLPITSFASVEVNFPSQETIERAWQLLQLGDEATTSDIKSSYFRLAQKHHPDASGTCDTSAIMGELTKAYHLLSACAKSSDAKLRCKGSAQMAIRVVRHGLDTTVPDTLQDVAA